MDNQKLRVESQLYEEPADSSRLETCRRALTVPKSELLADIPSPLDDVPEIEREVASEHELICSILYDSIQKKKSEVDLLEELRDFCYDRINTIGLPTKGIFVMGMPKNTHDEDIEDRWELETNTWDLLIRLINFYKTPIGKGLNESCRNAGVESRRNAVVESDLKKLEMECTRELEFYNVVKCWLESTYEVPDATLETDGTWVYTRKYIESVKTGLVNQKKNHNIVTEADPDAPFRQSKNLSFEDIKSDSKLLKHAFQYMRAGMMNKSFTLLEKHGQYWRSAIYRGSLISNNVNLDDYCSQNIGNCNRSVWIKVVKNIILQPECDLYERAIISFLIGDVHSLLDVCETWEDKVWAYYSCALKQGYEEILESDAISQYKQLAKEKFSPHLVFEMVKLAKPPDQSIPPRKFFHLIQENIILDRLEDLFTTAASVIMGPANDKKTEICPDILRFLSSLAIVLIIGNLVKTDTTFSPVFETYAMVLMNIDGVEPALFYLSFIDKSVRMRIIFEYLTKNYNNEKCSKIFNIADKYKFDLTEIILGLFSNLTSDEEYLATKNDVKHASVNEPLNQTESLELKILQWLMTYTNLKMGLINVSNFLIGLRLSFGRINAAKNLLDVINKKYENRKYLDDIVTDTDLNIKCDTILCSESLPHFDSALIEHIGYVCLIECFLKYEAWLSTFKDHLAEPTSLLNSSVEKNEINFIDATIDTEQTLKRYIMRSDLLFKASETPIELNSSNLHNYSTELHNLFSNSRKGLIQKSLQTYLPVIALFLAEIIQKTVKIVDSIYDSRNELLDFFSDTKPSPSRSAIKNSELYSKIIELIS